MDGNCQEVSEKMLKYIDGLLNNNDKIALESHISHCETCHGEFESIKQIVPHITSLDANNCPDVDLLVRFSENDVTFNESKEVKEHLERCPLCRKEVTYLFELNSEISLSDVKYEKKPMPLSLKSAVKEIYVSKESKKSTLPHWNLSGLFSGLVSKKRWVSAFASCSLALFMTLNGVYQLAPVTKENNLLQGALQTVQMSKTDTQYEAVKNMPIDYSKKQVLCEGKEEERYIAADNLSSNSKVFSSNVSYRQNEDENNLKANLENNISSLEGISSGQVALNRDKSGKLKPSVTVALEPDYFITSTQVSSIMSMVAASAGNISPSDVTVYDEHGLALSDNILTAQRDEFPNLTYDQQIKQHNFEELLTRNAQTVLDEKLGKGKAMVQVSSLVDFIVTEPIAVPGRTLMGNTEVQSYVPSVAIDKDKKGSYDEGMIAGEEKSFSYNRKKEGQSDFKVCVYPPGPVKKLNVAIATDENEDKEKIKEIVSNSVGLDYA
ncbi:MAG: zf-HC2 domain-containing protein, partial [Elusimicrobiota bacterium]